MNFFFYGSLRYGFWNARQWLPWRRPVAEATTVDRYRLFIQSRLVPCAVPDPTGYPLVGELWSLEGPEAEVVRVLEAGYQAAIISVQPKGAPVARAMIYYCQLPSRSPYSTPDDYEEPSGDFANVICKASGQLLKTSALG